MTPWRWAVIAWAVVREKLDEWRGKPVKIQQAKPIRITPTKGKNK